MSKKILKPSIFNNKIKITFKIELQKGIPHAYKITTKTLGIAKPSGHCRDSLG